MEILWGIVEKGGGSNSESVVPNGRQQGMRFLKTYATEAVSVKWPRVYKLHMTRSIVGISNISTRSICTLKPCATDVYAAGQAGYIITIELIHPDPSIGDQ